MADCRVFLRAIPFACVLASHTTVRRGAKLMTRTVTVGTSRLRCRRGSDDRDIGARNCERWIVGVVCLALVVIHVCLLWQKWLF